MSPKSCCPKCGRHNFVTPTEDHLAREPWIAGKTLRCMACGHAWDGTDRELVAALVDEMESTAGAGE